MPTLKVIDFERDFIFNTSIQIYHTSDFFNELHLRGYRLAILLPIRNMLPISDVLTLFHSFRYAVYTQVVCIHLSMDVC